MGGCCRSSWQTRWGAICTTCFISFRDRIIAGVRCVELVLEYCRSRKAAVQNLPSFPNSVLHRKPNFPRTLAATLGGSALRRRIASINTTVKFWTWRGLGSTFNWRSLCNTRVLKATPSTYATSLGTYVFSLSRLKPNGWKACCKQNMVTLPQAGRST